MQSDRELMQQALEALENTTAEWRALADSGDAGFWKAEDQDDYKQCVAAIAALRERLAQPEQDWDWRHPKAQALIGAKARLEITLRLIEQLLEDPHFEPAASDMEYWEPLHDKLQERLAQPEQSPLDRMAENARELGLDYEPVQEPVAHSVVAGALFDFMGWLTTCSERLVLSSADDAAPAADAIKNFAQMRSLSINDAQVQRWQEHLADSQPRQWVGLTEEEIDQTVDEEDWYNDPNEFARAIEAKLKEKNT